MGVTNMKKLSFEKTCLVSGKYWFVLNECSALCKCDMEDGVIRFETALPDIPADSQYLVADIKEYNGKLIIVPRVYNVIYIYNIENKEMEQLAIKEYDEKYKYYISWLKFINSVIVENRIFLIPRTYPSIVEINLDTYEIIYHEDIIKELDSRRESAEAYFWKDYIINDRYILFPSGNSNLLVKYLLKTKSFEIINMKEGNTGFSGVCSYKNQILLATRESGNICMYNEENFRKEDDIELPDLFSVKKIIGFESLIYSDDGIYAIPYWGNMLMYVKNGSKKAICIKQFTEKENGVVNEVCSWKKDNQIYCLENHTNTIDIYMHGELQNCIMLSLEKEFEYRFTKSLVQNECLNETEFNRLEDFIEAI